ncbi:hypothetical protein PR048_025938, partial [Dryococelus australis]
MQNERSGKHFAFSVAHIPVDRKAVIKVERVSEEIWAALNSEVSTEQRRNERAGENRRFSRKSVDRRHRPARFPHAEICVARPEIEPGSPWWEASRLTAQPPWPQLKSKQKIRALVITNHCKSITTQKENIGFFNYKHAVSLSVARRRHIGNAFHTTSANLLDFDANDGDYDDDDDGDDDYDNDHDDCDTDDDDANVKIKHDDESDNDDYDTDDDDNDDDYDDYDDEEDGVKDDDGDGDNDYDNYDDVDDDSDELTAGMLKTNKMSTSSLFCGSNGHRRNDESCAAPGATGQDESAIWAAVDIEVLEADVGEVRCVWSSAGMKGRDGAGDPRENPSTSGIVRHDPHMRGSGSDPAGGLNPVRLGRILATSQAMLEVSATGSNACVANPRHGLAKALQVTWVMSNETSP